MFTYTRDDEKTEAQPHRMLWVAAILAGLLTPALAQEPTSLPVPTPEPVVAPEAPVLPEVEWPLGWGEESAGSFWTNGWDEWFEDEVFWSQVPDAVDQIEDARARYYESVLQQQDIISQEEVLRQQEESLRTLREQLGAMQPQLYLPFSGDSLTVARLSEMAQAYQAAYRHILDERWNQARSTFEQFLESYGEQLGNSYIDDARFWICYAMEKLELPDEEVFEAYHQFVQEFTDSNWLDDARANLLEIGRRLAEINRKNAAQYGPIIEELEKEYEFEVALATVDQLRRVNNADNENAINAILSLYDRTENSEQRVRIINTLRRYSDSTVTEKLSEIAMNDPSDEVREAAVNALQRQGGEAAIRGLIALATRQEEWQSRQSAVRSLGTAAANLNPGYGIIERMITSPPSSGVITPDIYDFYFSASLPANELNAEQREALVKEVVTVLLDLARNDPHVRVRTEAVSALSRINTEEAQEALIDILEGG